MISDEELEQYIAEFRYYQAHTMIAQERIYDALLLIIDRMYDDNGATAKQLLLKHANHDYHWPDNAVEPKDE